MLKNNQFSFEGCINLLEEIFGPKIGPEGVKLIQEIAEKTQKPLKPRLGGFWKLFILYLAVVEKER